MATKVYFDGIWDYDGTYIFKTFEGDSIWVSSFENGIATVEPIAGAEINSFSSLVAGCFEDDSNFESELIKAFECDPESNLKGIKFEFNEATVLVTKENADRDKIVAEWRVQIEANSEKRRQEWEAYKKTPEYRAKRAKALKIQTRRDTVEQEVLFVDETTKLEFKDDEAKAKWKKFVEVNSKDGYSFGVVKYARRWAKYMQHLMKKHNKPLPQIAENASNVSDIEGVTGFMYGCAVSMLSECWKYGEELRKWHNKKYGQEDANGVVNPALLTISVG